MKRSLDHTADPRNMNTERKSQKNRYQRGVARPSTAGDPRPPSMNAGSPVRHRYVSRSQVCEELQLSIGSIVSFRYYPLSSHRRPSQQTNSYNPGCKWSCSHIDGVLSLACRERNQRSHRQHRSMRRRLLRRFIRATRRFSQAIAQRALMVPDRPQSAFAVRGGARIVAH